MAAWAPRLHSNGLVPMVHQWPRLTRGLWVPGTDVTPRATLAEELPPATGGETEAQREKG